MSNKEFFSREVAQTVRALGWGPRGRWGGTSLPDTIGYILTERSIENSFYILFNRSMLLSVHCFYCQKRFFRDSNHIQENQKLRHKLYCSFRCIGESKKKRQILSCENRQCNKRFERVISAISLHNFCSRSCAVSINNTTFPKHRRLQKTCAVCNKVFLSRQKYCSVPCKIKDQTTAPEVILKLIKKFYAKTGRIPLKREFQQARAARKSFGSWNSLVYMENIDAMTNYVKKNCN